MVYGAGNDRLREAAAAFYSHDPRGVLGPFLLGAMMDGFFMGLLLTQVVSYYRRFSRDSPWIRHLVALVILLSCLKSLQTIIILWGKLIDGFGDWPNIVDVNWVLYTEPVLSQILSFCAQSFFSWRCFVLMDRNYFVLFGLLTTMLSSLSLSAYVAYLYSVMPFNFGFIQRFTTPEMALNIVTDLSISIIVSIYLHKSHSGFNSRTDSALKKLLTVTWSAGIPPTISATLDMSTFFLSHYTCVHAFFNMFTPRLYCFSMMYALNSRSSIRDLLSETADFTLGRMRFANPDVPQTENESRYAGPLSETKFDSEINPESSGIIDVKASQLATA